MAIRKKIDVLACDFCGKDQHEVKTLVAGPNHVCICNECVALCVEIIDGKGEADTTVTTEDSSAVGA